MFTFLSLFKLLCPLLLLAKPIYTLLSMSPTNFGLMATQTHSKKSILHLDVPMFSKRTKKKSTKEETFLSPLLRHSKPLYLL